MSFRKAIDKLLIKHFGDNWECRLKGCNVRNQPHYTGIHSVLRMGCHKVDCKRCGQVHEFDPS